MNPDPERPFRVICWRFYSYIYTHTHTLSKHREKLHWAFSSMTLQRQLIPTGLSKVHRLTGDPLSMKTCVVPPSSFSPSPSMALFHWLRLPYNNQGLHGGHNDKMKASCVSVEVLMTFRAAVEILGLVQTHTAPYRKTKKLMGALQDCSKHIWVPLNVVINTAVVTVKYVQ